MAHRVEDQVDVATAASLPVADMCRHFEQNRNRLDLIDVFGRCFRPICASNHWVPRPTGFNHNWTAVMRAVRRPTRVHEDRFKRLDEEVVTAEVDFRIGSQIEPNRQTEVPPLRHAAIIVVPAETIGGRGADDVDSAGRVEAGDLFDKLNCRWAEYGDSLTRQMASPWNVTQSRGVPPPPA